MNLIRNGNFSQWPLGTSFAVAAGASTTALGGDLSYVATGAQQPAATISRQAFAFGDTLDEGAPNYFLQFAPTTAPTSGALTSSYLKFSILSDLTLTERVATLTFWANTTVDREIVVRASRQFIGGVGPGGQSEVTCATQSMQLRTGWRKYKMEFRFPAFTGATHAATDVTNIKIFFQGDSATLGSQQIPWKAATLKFAQVSFVPYSIKDFENEDLPESAGGSSTPQDFGAIGNGVTNDYAALVSWLATGNDLYLPAGNYLLSTNLTIPYTKRVRFAPGAILSPGAGIILSVESIDSISAGMQQIFGTVGTVRFGRSPYGMQFGNYVPVTWFGADPNFNFGSGNDSATAFARAITAATFVGAFPLDIYVPPGAYIVRSTISLAGRIRIFGSEDGTYIYFDPTVDNDNMFEVGAGGSDSITISKFRLNNLPSNTRAGATAIFCDAAGGGVTEFFIDDVDITGFRKYGVCMSNTVYYLRMNHVRVFSTQNGRAIREGTGAYPGRGLYLNGAGTLTMESCRFGSNDQNFVVEGSGAACLVARRCTFEQGGVSYYIEGREKWTNSLTNLALAHFDTCYWEGEWSVLTGGLMGTSFGLTTLSQAATTVTASASAFTADMVGGVIVFKNSVTATVSAYISPTQVTVTTSASVAAQTACIRYSGVSFSQALFVVTATKPVFTPAMVGWKIYYTEFPHVIVTITGYTDPTHVTVDQSRTEIPQGVLLYQATAAILGMSGCAQVRFTQPTLVSNYNGLQNSASILRVQDGSREVIVDGGVFSNPVGSFVSAETGVGEGIVRVRNTSFVQELEFAGTGDEYLKSLDVIAPRLDGHANIDLNAPFFGTWALTTIAAGASVTKDFAILSARLDNRATVRVAIDGLPVGDIQTYARVTANGVVSVFIRNNTVGIATINATVNVTIEVSIPAQIIP
jgi:hypothetical protein